MLYVHMLPYLVQVDVLTHISFPFPKQCSLDHLGIKIKLQEDLDSFPQVYW